MGAFDGKERHLESMPIISGLLRISAALIGENGLTWCGFAKTPFRNIANPYL